MTVINRIPLRVLAASAALALAGSLVSAAPSVADDADPQSLIAELGGGEQNEPSREQQGRQAAGARGPATSSTDFANGATHRSARIADVTDVNDGTVVRADVVQDLARQQLRATVTLKSGAADRLVIAYFGERSGGACHAGAAIAGHVTTAGTETGQFLPGTSTFPVTRARSGSTLTLTSQARATFRTAEYDCAYIVAADLATNTATQNFLSERLTTHWKPKFTITGGPTLQAAQKGTWVTMRLEVRNSSGAPATNVRITAAGKGLTIKPRVRSLGTIGERSTEYGVTFKARVAKGAKSRKLTYTVSGGGVKATKKFTIGVAPKPKKYTSLSGRYFWGYASTTLSDTRGWDNQVMWFLDKRWVHIGEARNGAVPKCRKTTKTCKKYAYNARTGVAKIGRKTFKVTNYGFVYQAPKEKSRRYEAVTFPKKNAKLGAALINRDWSGNCLLTCTARTTNLTLDRKGNFVRGSWSVGSWPGLGSSWSIIPPDQAGKYRIISRGRIELTFKNGKRERHRIALLHNARNKPSATAGVVLGTKNFYFED